MPAPNSKGKIDLVIHSALLGAGVASLQGSKRAGSTAVKNLEGGQ